MFEVRRFSECKPSTDADRAAAERVSRAWQSAADRSVIGRGRRIVNRLADRKKDRFIESFLREDDLSGYPANAEDCDDENAYPSEPSDESGAPTRRADTLGASLAGEIARAYRLTAHDGPDPVVLAGSLLRSEHSVERLDLSETPPRRISVAFVLAHLEALGYDLPARVSATVARRATVVLLDRITHDKSAA
ncbi:MAG: hypothetical protein JRD89_02410 [Deltaproteobacteria bacterium]|nr:hypothetical protein [Deltaproteobacteria bacterium]